MRKFFFPLVIFFFSYRAETPVENSFKSPIAKIQDKLIVPKSEPILVLAPQGPTKTITLRGPAQVASGAVVAQPRRLNHLVIRNSNVESPTGEWIASNIAALPLVNYDPSFGKEIYRDSKFAYFEGKTEESVPAAFDPVTQRFHPISEVLLLKKINEGLRQEILDEGHKEYYYNQRMGILSIQSSSGEVLALYEQFKKRGIDVRIEVLKETAKPR